MHTFTHTYNTNRYWSCYMRDATVANGHRHCRCCEGMGGDQRENEGNSAT